MTGLTARQRWALGHIVRCPTCGGWELVTEEELQKRPRGEGSQDLCAHLRPPEREDQPA